jgi:hypothetical protein
MARLPKKCSTHGTSSTLPAPEAEVPSEDLWVTVAAAAEEEEDDLWLAVAVAAAAATARRLEVGPGRYHARRHEE